MRLSTTASLVALPGISAFSFFANGRSATDRTTQRQLNLDALKNDTIVLQHHYEDALHLLHDDMREVGLLPTTRLKKMTQSPLSDHPLYTQTRVFLSEIGIISKESLLEPSPFTNDDVETKEMREQLFDKADLLLTQIMLDSHQAEVLYSIIEDKVSLQEMKAVCTHLLAQIDEINRGIERANIAGERLADDDYLIPPLPGYIKLPLLVALPWGRALFCLKEILIAIEKRYYGSSGHVGQIEILSVPSNARRAASAGEAMLDELKGEPKLLALVQNHSPTIIEHLLEATEGLEYTKGLVPGLPLPFGFRRWRFHYCINSRCINSLYADTKMILNEKLKPELMSVLKEIQRQLDLINVKQVRVVEELADRVQRDEGVGL